MESIGYVLLYLLKGSLPWQGLKCKDKTEKYQKIKELKMSTPPEKLCEGLPIEFAKYIEYVKKLAFEEEPEYKKYIMLFTELFKQKDFEMDYMYDWITVKNNTRVLKEASICRSDEFSKAQNQIDKKNRNDNNIDSTMKDNNDTKAIGDSNYKNQQSMMKAFEKYNDKENFEGNDIEGNGKKKGKGGKNEKCYVF